MLAAGSWSSSLADDLPFALPVQPAKGYSVTFDNPGVRLTRPLIMAEARAGVNPMGSMIRVAGTLEMTGIDLNINMRRVKAVVRCVADYLDGIDEDLALQNPWCGMRPLHPRRTAGHRHAPIRLEPHRGHRACDAGHDPRSRHRKLVADLACDREPTTDPTPYNPARFQ